MKSFIALSLIAALALTGCASIDPVTGQRQGVAHRVQDMLKQIVTEPLDALKADAVARITTIDAQVAAGRMTPISASQKKQCAQNIVTFVDGVQSQIGMQIPEGAGLVWMLGIVNDMQDEQLQVMETQVKLTFDSGKNQFNLKLRG